MPYTITKKGDRFFVGNKATGRVTGSYTTKRDALRELKARTSEFNETKKDVGSNVKVYLRQEKEVEVEGTGEI